MHLVDEALDVPGEVGDADGLDPGLEELGELAGDGLGLGRQRRAVGAGGRARLRQLVWGQGGLARLYKAG